MAGVQGGTRVREGGIEGVRGEEVEDGKQGVSTLIVCVCVRRRKEEEVDGV
jgi:hypothetical protein